MDTKTTLATKDDLALACEKVRKALDDFKTSLIRWMFFFFVLNLITYFIFFWLISK